MSVITDKFKKADENNRLLSAYRPLPPIATQLDLLRLMRDDDTVNDTVNDTVKSDVSALSKTEQTVLAAISSFPDYSYEKLATYSKLSRPTIARTIKSLQSRELIRRIGSDKTGHWEVIKETCQ